MLDIRIKLRIIEIMELALELNDKEKNTKKIKIENFILVDQFFKNNIKEKKMVL